MTTINHTQPLNAFKDLSQNKCLLLPYATLSDDELLAEVFNSSPNPLVLELAHRLENYL